MKSIDQLKALLKRKWKIKRHGRHIFIEGPKDKKEKTGQVFNLFTTSLFSHPFDHENLQAELAELLKNKLEEALTEDLTESILPFEVDNMKHDKPKNCTVAHIWHWWPKFNKLIMDKGGNLTGVNADGQDIHLYKRYNIEDWPEGESIIQRDKK